MQTNLPIDFAMIPE